MSSSPVQRTIVIQNEQGLHARPAEMFARTATRFQSKIVIIRGGERIDAKSILHLLTLGAQQGTELCLEAQGPDADEAVDVLARLVDSSFAADEPAAVGEKAGDRAGGASPST